MAFSRVATLLHAVLSDVTAAQHHTATVAGDLNLADMAERLHASLTSVGITDHIGQSTQADMEGEVVSSRYVRSHRTRFSPSAVKFWVKYEQTGAHSMLANYNMDSVTDGSAAGDTDGVITDDFSSAEWCMLAMGSGITHIAQSARAAGTWTAITANNDGSPADTNHNFVAGLGDQ